MGSDMMKGSSVLEIWQCKKRVSGERLTLSKEERRQVGENRNANRGGVRRSDVAARAAVLVGRYTGITSSKISNVRSISSDVALLVPDELFAAQHLQLACCGHLLPRRAECSWEKSEDQVEAQSKMQLRI